MSTARKPHRHWLSLHPMTTKATHQPPNPIIFGTRTDPYNTARATCGPRRLRRKQQRAPSFAHSIPMATGLADAYSGDQKAQLGSHVLGTSGPKPSHDWHVMCCQYRPQLTLYVGGRSGDFPSVVPAVPPPALPAFRRHRSDSSAAAAAVAVRHKHAAGLGAHPRAGNGLGFLHFVQRAPVLPDMASTPGMVIG